MSKLKLDISISLDGCLAGPDQTLDEPLGRHGERLHEWAFATASSSARTEGRTARRASTTSSPARRSQAPAPGLLDELQLHVVPVLLGDGVRLFDGHVAAPPGELQLTRVVESPTGVTHLRYAIAR